jgi:hypothetical protein
MDFCDSGPKFQKFKNATKDASEISTKIKVRPLGVLNLSLKFQTNHEGKPLIRGL